MYNMLQMTDQRKFNRDVTSGVVIPSKQANIFAMKGRLLDPNYHYGEDANELRVFSLLTDQMSSLDVKVDKNTKTLEAVLESLNKLGNAVTQLHSKLDTLTE